MVVEKKKVTRKKTTKKKVTSRKKTESKSSNLRASQQPTIKLYNPSNPKYKKTIKVTSSAELQKSVERSRSAQEIWSGYTLENRINVLTRVFEKLRDNADNYADEISRFNGKTPYEAMTQELIPVLNTFKYFLGQSEKQLKDEFVFLSAIPVSQSKIVYDPLGVIGIISPWNFPFFLTLYRQQLCDSTKRKTCRRY